jgi:hypothetical protein
VGLERFSGWRGSLLGGCSGRSMAGGVLPTVTRGGGGRVNGDGVASAGIRWRLGVGEHEQVMGKLDAGSIGAEKGLGGVLHGEQGAAAAMACGGTSGARAGGERREMGWARVGEARG